jgi:hypothetical protein
MSATLNAQGHFQPALDQQWQLDQIEIQSGKLFSEHLQIRPLDKTKVIEEIISLKSCNGIPDTTNAMQLVRDHVELLYKDSVISNTEFTYLKNTKPFLKYFYKDGTHFLSAYKKNFQISLDPLLHFDIGKQDTNLLFINRRGIRVQGNVDERIHFYTDIVETQLTVPNYVHDYVDLYQSLPGAGLYKIYNSKFPKVDRAYDYLFAEANVDFKVSKHVQISLGHGRQFIGSGMRSLFLSDFSTPRFYLKINTNIWKLHYQNLFTELTPESNGDKGDRLLDKKYMAAHYLSINLTKNWNAGIYESVVFSRKNSFELQYLNPVILYRFIEHSLGSPDNVFIGFHSNILLRKRFSFYGQILFDEFLLKEFFSSRGWWGNKYGFQVGCKYINAFGWKNLYLQLEYNQARPFTYSFRDSIANYSHYQQALAHPLGANFKELMFAFHYQPDDRWTISAQSTFYTKGLDSTGVNNGGNILLDYDTRASDFGHTTTQGIANTIFSGSLNVSYRLFYRAWLDLNVNFRSTKVEQQESNNTVWISGSFRMNLDKLRFDF